MLRANQHLRRVSRAFHAAREGSTQQLNIAVAEVLRFSGGGVPVDSVRVGAAIWSSISSGQPALDPLNLLHVALRRAQASSMMCAFHWRHFAACRRLDLDA